MIIKNKTIVDDDWNVLHLGENDTPESVVIPPGKIIVPLKVWRISACGLPAMSARKICKMR
jgi:hypothetical protein